MLTLVPLAHGSRGGPLADVYDCRAPPERGIPGTDTSVGSTKSMRHGLEKSCSSDQVKLETNMTSFDGREKAFENKFAHDADLKFKAESRRNKMLAEWAAAKMGIAGAAIEDYIKAVRKADLAEKGDDDVMRKVAKDLADKGVKVSDTDLRKQMDEFLATAVQQIESSKG
jgi:hypothetical protein